MPALYPFSACRAPLWDGAGFWPEFRLTMNKTISDMMKGYCTRTYDKRVLNDPCLGYDLIFLSDQADHLKPPAALPRKSTVYLRKLRASADHFACLRPMADKIV